MSKQSTQPSKPLNQEEMFVIDMKLGQREYIYQKDTSKWIEKAPIAGSQVNQSQMNQSANKEKKEKALELQKKIDELKKQIKEKHEKLGAIDRDIRTITEEQRANTNLYVTECLENEQLELYRKKLDKIREKKLQLEKTL